MKHIRIDALTSLLDNLEAFEIDLNQYYGDAEPQGIIDDVLTGKIDSLRAFCQTLGWSDLVTSMRDMTPLHRSAVESLELVQSYVTPEARRLLLSTDVEEVPSRKCANLSWKLKRLQTLWFDGIGRNNIKPVRERSRDEESVTFGEKTQEEASTG